MLTRKPEAQMDFDFAKVVEASKDNPVFYVQYAHARVHSVQRKAAEAGVSLDMTLDDAIARVARLVGAQLDWTVLEAFLPETEDAKFLKSALASSFVAALELARQGRVDIAQDSAFAPLMIRKAASTRPA